MKNLVSSFKIMEKRTKDGLKEFGFDAELIKPDEFDLYPVIVLSRFYQDMRNYNYKKIDKIDIKNIIKQIIKLFKNGSLLYLDFRFKIIKFSTDGFKYDINVMSYHLINIIDDLIKEMIKHNIDGYMYARCKDNEKVIHIKDYLDETKRLGCETFMRIATSIEYIKKTDEFFNVGAREFNKKYKT